jgi:mevalonate kinase
MVTVSAPGKVHLIGEHAVVYGEPAILAAIDKRCFVNATKNPDLVVRTAEAEAVYDINEVTYFVSELRNLWHKCADKKDFSEMFEAMKEDPLNLVKAAVGEVLLNLNIDTGADLEIKSQIPIGAGLGSSAAFAVAAVKATSALYDKDLSKEEVNDIAFSVEKYMHGTPSGGDNSTCCYGGLVWFQRTMQGNVIRNLSPPKLDNFFLIYIGRPEKSTGELVQHVRNLEESYRQPRIAEISRATHDLLEAIMNSDVKRIRDCVNKAQKNLAELGVSTTEIDELCKAVRNSGGAAKLSGAGGGGVVLCYHEDKLKLSEGISDLGLSATPTVLGEEGVRVESI